MIEHECQSKLSTAKLRQTIERNRSWEKRGWKPELNQNRDESLGRENQLSLVPGGGIHYAAATPTN